MNLDAIIALALMTHVLRSEYYELHHVDEKIFRNFLMGKVIVDCICDKGLFISWTIFCVCSGDIYHIKS